MEVLNEKEETVSEVNETVSFFKRSINNVSSM